MMSLKRKVTNMIRLYIILLLFISYESSAQKIYVADFGAKENSFLDATLSVQKAIESCRDKGQCTLVFAKGRYDFWPEMATLTQYYMSNTSSEQEIPDKQQRIGLFFKNISNITIEGNGAQFVFHGKMIAWAIDSCQNIQIRNLSVNYERPGMSEMTIKHLSKDSVTVTMHPDSRFAILDKKISLYGEKCKMENPHAILVKPDSGLVTYSNWNPFSNSTVRIINPSTITFTGDFTKFNAKPGDILTVRDRYRDYVGLFHNRSKNISLKNLNLNYMHGLGILSQFCDNLNYDSVYIEPEKTRGRVISSSADGMHFSGCKGVISINHCRFNGLHDDPINIHGTYLKVSEILTPTNIKVRFMHPQTYGFPAFYKGDTVSYVHASAIQPFGVGVVKSASLISRYEMAIELESALPSQLSTDDVLENVSYNAAVIIRNSRFERTVSRGTITKTPKKVLIENNTYYRTGMHAIFIVTDASYWYESGAVKDVTIRNNQFIECGYNSGTENYPIKIVAQNPELLTKYYVHQNITITKNLFKIYDSPLLSARSTRGLYFVDNRIEKTKLMVTGNRRASFYFNACTKVKILKNIFPEEVKPEVILQNMTKKDLKIK